MDIVVIIIAGIVVTYTIYDIVRKKYEVFGVVIEPEKGAKAVELKKFRTRKNAVKHYQTCRDRYEIASISEF